MYSHLRYFIRPDKQFLYKLSSPIVHVLLSENTVRKKRNTKYNLYQVSVEFMLPFYKNAPFRWDLCCGVVTSFGQNWKFDVCRSTSLSTYAIRCSCNHSGMFALFAAELPIVSFNYYFGCFIIFIALTKHFRFQTANERSKEYHMMVIIGCVCCFVQCFISFCIQLFRWFRVRSCLRYLKIQICACTAVTMLLFLYGSCDPPSVSFL